MVKRAFQYLLVLSLGVFVGLVAFELLVRLLVPQRLVVGARYLYEESPTLGFALSKNYEGTWSTVEYSTSIRTNSMGLRDREFGEKQDGTFRILGLGDSFTFSAGVSLEQTYLKVLEQSLQDLSTRKVEVVNAGVSGYGPEHYLQYLKETIETLKPDLVTVGFYVGNDVEDRILSDYYVKSGWLYRRSDGFSVKQSVLYPINNFLEQHSHAFVFTRTRLDHLLWRVGLRPYYFPEVFRRNYSPAMTESWVLTERGLRELANLAEEHHARVAIIAIPTNFQVYEEIWNQFIEVYDIDEASVDLSKPQALLTDIGVRHRIPVLDLVLKFREVGQTSQLYFPIDGHWNREGHRLAGEETARFLAVQGLVP